MQQPVVGNVLTCSRATHIHSNNHLRIVWEALVRGSGRGIAITSVIVVIVSSLWFSVAPSLGQTTRAFRAPRTADGRPDLNGIWEAIGTAYWNIEAHEAKAGPIVVMGAVGGIPGGLGVVEGGPLPYRPEALVKKKENAENWLARDPVVGYRARPICLFRFKLCNLPSTSPLAMNLHSLRAL